MTCSSRPILFLVLVLISSMLPVAFSLSPLENSVSSPPGAFVVPIDEEQATTTTSQQTDAILSVQINIANNPTTLGAIQTIIVIVLDQGGKPVPEAMVHLEVTSPSGSTTVLDESTDASGVHTFVMQIQALLSSVGTFQAKASAKKAGYQTGQAEATFEVTAEGNPPTTSTQTVTVTATSTTVIPVYSTTLIPTTTTVTQTQVLTTTQKSVITTLTTATLTTTAFTNVTNTQTVTTSAAKTTHTTETTTETSTSYTMVLSTTISMAVTTLTSSVQVTRTITIIDPVAEVVIALLTFTTFAAVATLLVPRIRARRFTSRVCRQCGYSNPPYAHSFCIKCGNPLEASKT